MEGDSTESFVDISGGDESIEEKEQPCHENSDQKPDTSQDITCDNETEETPNGKDPTYSEETRSQEPTELDRSSNHKKETNTEDGYENSPENEDSTPSETLGLEENADQDMEMTLEGNQEAQTVSNGYRSPQATCEGFEEDQEEHKKTLVSDKPEPQGDKNGSMGSNPKEVNGQDGKESDVVSTEETTEGSQDAKEARKEQPETQADEVMYKESQENKDLAEDDDLSEQKMTEGDWEQLGKPREKTSESTSEEPPRLETGGSEQSLWTSRIDGAVTLRMEESGLAAVCSVTVSQFFSEAVRRHGHKVALCVGVASNWEAITYSQYEQQSRAVARGFLKLGLQQLHAVLILGLNSPEWFMAEIGAMLAGGSAVAADPSSTASFILKVAQDSRAQIVLVDDHNQLEKILQIRAQLPDLRVIIQWSGRVLAPGPGVYTWKQLVNLGLELEEPYLDVVIANQKPQQCCAVIYSPDEAGEPRGAMISHDNVTWTSRALQEMLGLGSEEVVLSYLPLSDMSVQLFDLWLPLSCGGTTYFAEPEAQKGSLVSTLCDVRPTIFLGFPGLWEKVNKRWMLVERKATPLQKMTISWARKISHCSYIRRLLRSGREYMDGATYLLTCHGAQTGRSLIHSCRTGDVRTLLMPRGSRFMCSGSRPWGHRLAEHLVFRPARMALGLDRCSLCYVGTEPISEKVAEYFGSLGIDLLELCGKNETSGVESIMLPSSRRTGRVQLAGCKSLGNQDGPGRCLWGRNIFLGYLGLEKVTSAAFTEDGWFITGSQQLLKTRPEDPGDPYMEL